MTKPQTLIRLDSWLKIPHYIFRQVYHIWRHIFPASVQDRDQIVVIKLMGMGSIIKLIYLYEKHQVDINKIVICTLKRNEAICRLLGLEKLVLIRTENPFLFIKDALSSFGKIKTYAPHYVVDLERGSNGLAVYRMLVSMVTGAKTIAFSFAKNDLVKKDQFFFSMVNRTHTELFLKTIPFCPKGSSPSNTYSRQVDPQKIIVNINASEYIKARRYPQTLFQKVIEQLHELRPDSQFYLSGSPDEKSYVDAFISLFDQSEITLHNMCGRWSLSDLALNLHEAQLFITNDSGPMHLGAYLESPIIVIWGPTNPSHTGYENQAYIQNISLDLPCSPCFTHPRSKVGRACQSSIDCMNNLNPQKIVEACLSLMDKQSEEQQMKT